MKARWYRVGNFFVMNKNSSYGFALDYLFAEKNPHRRKLLWDRFAEKFGDQSTHTVTFRAEYSNTIKQIHITRNFRGDIQLYLTPASSSKKHAVYQACQIIFKDQLVIQNKYSISIKYSSKKYDTDSFIESFDVDSVLKSIQEIAKEDLSSALILDIKKILQYRPNLNDLNNTKNFDYQHRVTDGKYINSHVNPYRMNSRALIRLFEKSNIIPFDELICEFRKLLPKGEDVDQQENGRSALWWAICQKHNIFLFLLLCYGANALKRHDEFTRDAFTFTSAREHAEELKDFAKVDMIDSFLFPNPTQSLSELPDKIKLTILSQFLTGRRDYLQSVFVTENQLITSLTIPLAHLVLYKKYEDLYNELFTLFANTFKTPDGDAIKLKEIFDADFIHNQDCDKQWITLVFEKDANAKGYGNLIGCNRFDLLKTDKLPTKYHDHLVLHWVFSLADPRYRGNRLMPILFQQFSVGMQLINPKKKVAVVFSSIHPSSYHMIKDLRHTPKYSSDHIPELLQTALKLIYKNGMTELHPYNGTMTWYFKETVALQVVGPELPPDKMDPITLFFKKILSGSAENVAVPVLFYASDAIYSLSKSLYTLGIKNSVEYISQYSQAMRRFIYESPGFTTSFPRGPLLFFGNQNSFQELEVTPQKSIEHSELTSRM